MRIPKEEWQAMNIKSPINKWKMWGFVRANYCDSMTAKSLCPKKCWECEPYLREAIEKMNGKDIKKPIGLLIYILRNLVAQQQELANPSTSVDRDKYKPQANPFDELLKDLEDHEA